MKTFARPLGFASSVVLVIFLGSAVPATASQIFDFHKHQNEEWFQPFQGGGDWGPWVQAPDPWGGKDKQDYNLWNGGWDYKIDCNLGDGGGQGEVPEPSTVVPLAAAMLVGFGILRRRVRH